MVVSMTGFGRSKKETELFAVTVEIKTVNHRFSECIIKMPRQLIKIEDKLRKRMGEYIQRGRIEAFVNIAGDGLTNRKVHVDWELLDEYHHALLSMKEKYAIQDSLSIHDLIHDELIRIEDHEVGDEELDSLILAAVDEACRDLKQMRLLEGSELERDLNLQLYLLRDRMIKVAEFAPKVAKQYEERLVKRMQGLLKGEIDEARLLTEVAVFADKADINEELTRLESHIHQFDQTIQLSEPIGRKLDFLLQEMNREVNTIGSKANDSSIASEVVEMKSLLEKMKEQVQNIE